MNEPSHPLPPLHKSIAVVGMNAVGKSGFGRSLSAKIRRKRIDTDTEFRRRHGDQQAYITAHGWDAFRKAEETIVLASLLPEYIVVLGGGAIESPAIRKALREKAVVLWIQAGQKRIKKHLKVVKMPRPEFHAKPMHETVNTLVQKRTPLYEEIADLTLPPHLSFAERVPAGIALLQEFARKNPST